MKAYSPDGSPIIGTSETLLACARTLEDGFARDGAGALTWEHEGSSELWWDTMETQGNADGEVLFTDAEGRDWPASALVLCEDEFVAPAGATPMTGRHRPRRA